MGVKAEFSNITGSNQYAGLVHVSDYSVDEASSPLAAGDSSGSVGSFTLTVPRPDPNTASFGPKEARLYSAETLLIGSDVTLTDSRRGFTLGTVRNVSTSLDGGSVTVTGETRLGKLNIYGVQAQPFMGTLGEAFEYYLSLAGVTTDLFTDPAIASRPVVLPGWSGELWYHLKILAAAQQADLSLVSGIVLLRPVRARVAETGRDINRSVMAGGDTLAQSVEVYQYNNRQITNELVYPPGGWNAEVDVLNVNAGETQEYTLEMSASLTSFNAPTMKTFVPKAYDGTGSAYTVVADDGLPVQPAAWTQYGGSLDITLDPDTKRLKVKLTGATGLPTSKGEAAKQFSVALASDESGNRYSTLRITGSGVAFDKQKVAFPTGVPASQTGTEVGVTIDNPFLSTTEQVYRAGALAARQYAGPVMSLTGQVVAVNRRDDSGQVIVPSYNAVKELLQNRVTPFTYDGVTAHFAGETYNSAQEKLAAELIDPNLNQLFGNVAGVRVFDHYSRRWYRVRQATINPAGISFGGADDDLTYADMQGVYAGKTYNDLTAAFGNLTYSQYNLIGMVAP